MNLLDSSFFLSEQSAPFWAALSIVVSTLSTWRLSINRINASIERAVSKTNMEVSTAGAVERIIFQARLKAEMDAIRMSSKYCGKDRGVFHAAAVRPELPPPAPADLAT